jgi:hypothetical protein
VALDRKILFFFVAVFIAHPSLIQAMCRELEDVSETIRFESALSPSEKWLRDAQGFAVALDQLKAGNELSAGESHDFLGKEVQLGWSTDEGPATRVGQVLRVNLDGEKPTSVVFSSGRPPRKELIPIHDLDNGRCGLIRPSIGKDERVAEAFRNARKSGAVSFVYGKPVERIEGVVLYVGKDVVALEDRAGLRTE